MPNRLAHALIGAGSGLAAGVVLSDDLPSDARVVYSLAASLGGLAGGVTPDALEPAVHPYHRDAFHSAAAGGSLYAGALKAASSVATKLRTDAAQLRATRRALPATHSARRDLGAREFLHYVLLGLAAGFVAGYLSHLIADLGTPRGIPVVARRLG